MPSSRVSSSGKSTNTPASSVHNNTDKPIGLLLFKLKKKEKIWRFLIKKKDVRKGRPIF